MILHMDDDVSMLALVSLSLAEYTVISADSWDVALGLLRTNEFTHAIIDIKMDDTNGIEMRDWLLNQYPNVKIIILSSLMTIFNDDFKDQERISKQDDYIKKLKIILRKDKA